MRNFKIWLLILTTTFLAYAGSLRYGFSQDDWYFLLISRASNLDDVLRFFNPFTQSGFAFFRPLGTQLYYFIFNQNPLTMHIFMLLLQSFNGYLVIRLVERLKLKSPTSILIGILYTISSVHFLSLYYIAATQQLLATTFSLLSLIYFMDRKHSTSALLFVLALFSKETAIVVPAVALILILLSRSKSTFKSFLPYGTIFVLYLLIRLMTSSGVQAEYQLSFGPSVLTNLRWYFLFAANLPEALVSYGLPRMGINLIQFISDYGTSALIITLSSSLVALFALTRLVLSKRWLYALWFVVGLGPVILLRDHLYPHYLDLALIPFLLLLLENLKAKNQYLVAVFYILTSLYSIQFSQDHHWTTGRADIAKTALTTYDWKGACGQESIVFVGEGRVPLELSYALSLANGPRVICDQPSLGVYYEGVDKTWPSDAYVIKAKL